ncbi:MAG: radical SAM protein [Paraclostridium sp.]
MAKTLLLDEKIRDYKIYIEKIKGDNTFYRLGKIFSTLDQKYFYDTGTGKVFNIEEHLYNVLDCMFENENFDSILELDLDEESLLSALKELTDAIANENILQAPPVTKFTGPHSYNLEEYLEKSINQVTLEVTERCNLRCKYCIYTNNNFHSFSNKDMPFETAKKVLDYAYSRAKEDFHLGFYGGEPLLNFELIKECVEYSKKLVKDKNIHYSMTTNAVLVNEEIAEFLQENNFTITVSIDGPEELHDENRVLKNGAPTFTLVEKGLKTLFEEYTKFNKEFNIHFNMVIPPVNIYDRLEKIQDFIDNTSWIPKNIPVTTNYVSTGRFKYDYIEPTTKHQKSMNAKYIDPLIEWSLNKSNRTYKKKRLISNPALQQQLYLIHSRILSEKPIEEYYFNGCCIPGSRRLHVDVNGNFLPCEKVGTSPYIGHADTGFDLDSIKKHYVENFSKEASKYCNNCWAVHICGSCYLDCHDKDKVDLSYRHEGCEYIRYKTEESLKLYHEFLEKDPDSVRELNEIKYI